MFESLKSDRGCEGKDLALCWNAEVQMLCVHALGTCLCCFCMSEPCIHARINKHEQP